MHLLRCTACRITATVAPHKLTNIPISVQFVILYLISRNYQRVLEEQLGGHLLWLDVKYAGCIRLASAGAGLLNNTGVRVVFVAVVAVFVLLFAGHLCLLLSVEIYCLNNCRLSFGRYVVELYLRTFGDWAFIRCCSSKPSGVGCLCVGGISV